MSEYAFPKTSATREFYIYVKTWREGDKYHQLYSGDTLKLTFLNSVLRIEVLGGLVKLKLKCENLTRQCWIDVKHGHRYTIQREANSLKELLKEAKCPKN